MVMTAPVAVARNLAFSGMPDAGSGVVVALIAAAMAVATWAAVSPAPTVRVI